MTLNSCVNRRLSDYCRQNKWKKFTPETIYLITRWTKYRNNEVIDLVMTPLYCISRAKWHYICFTTFWYNKTQVIWAKLTWRAIAAVLPPGQSCIACNRIIMCLKIEYPRLMPQISCAACLDLSLAISAQFTLKMCRSPESWKIPENP